MSTAIIFDTEVNGFRHKECIELAHAHVTDEFGHIQVSDPITERFRPEHPMEAGAAAIHGITLDELQECRKSHTAEIPQSDFVIGHNVDFDCEVLGIMFRRRICTLALCKHLWPVFEQHTLAAMYLELNGITAENVHRIKQAHSATADVEILANILAHILTETGITSLADLHRLSEVARIPTVWTFGMHKGKLISETPRDYIRWMMRQSDVDPYLMKALKAEIEGRDGDVL